MVNFMAAFSRPSHKNARETLASMHLLSELARILRVAPDVEGAFHQAVNLLEARALRRCLGIVLWSKKSERKLVFIGGGDFHKCLGGGKGTTSCPGCWKEGEPLAPRIHLKEGKNIVVRNEASFNEVRDLSGVDAMCHPVAVGDQMALSIAVRPLGVNQLALQEELILVSAVCMLLKQWIELRFDPREFVAPAESSPRIIPYLNALQADGVSIEEILIHRIGEMASVCAAGLLASKSLYSRIVELVEKGVIRWALCRTNMVQSDAAQILGINRNTLRTKMKLYGLFNPK